MHSLGGAAPRRCPPAPGSSTPAADRSSDLGGTETVLLCGGSAIISPLGKVLAGPYFEGETILTADLDLHDIGRGKFDFDIVGHYCRPDIFQLIVNDAPTPAVVVKAKT